MQWGTVDYRQLKKLRENLVKLQSADLEKFCIDASKELAGRLLALVIPRTPVGAYPKSTGKTGGTLRRGWTGKRLAAIQLLNTPRACRFISAAAPITLRLSTPCIMPAMLNLDTARRAAMDGCPASIF